MVIRKFCLYLLGIMLTGSLCADTADLLIFSKDRPLQLQALLESIIVHVRGVKKIVVLYHAANDQFSQAYDVLIAKFIGVQFVQQDRYQPRRDFMVLLRRILEYDFHAPYIMFAVDDMIVTNPCNLDLCTSKLQSTGAYGCYLRLGRDISYCYPMRQNTPPPALQSVGDGMYTWRLRDGGGDWGYQHTVDMTLYPRHVIDTFLKRSAANTPNSLEGQWSCIPMPQGARGLCYETSRVINIPLNLVQTELHNRCSHAYSVEALLCLFNEGKRIDVARLSNLPHRAPHVEIDIPLTSLPLNLP